MVSVWPTMAMSMSVNPVFSQLGLSLARRSYSTYTMARWLMSKHRNSKSVGSECLSSSAVLIPQSPCM